MFALPSWLALIPSSQGMADKDKALKDLQGQWGLMALALSCGVVHLTAAVLVAVHQVDEDPSSASVALLSVKVGINICVAVILAPPSPLMLLTQELLELADERGIKLRLCYLPGSGH